MRNLQEHLWSICDTSLASDLLTAGLDPYYVNAEGLTFLHRAAIEGRVGMVNAILNTGFDVDILGGICLTPLFMAAKHYLASDKAVILSLIEANADVCFRGGEGCRTILHEIMAHDPEPEVVQALIDAGSTVDTTDENGFTPLHWGLQNGNLSSGPVDVLLKEGANPNSRNDLGESVLETAIIKKAGRVAINVLLRAGANVHGDDTEESAMAEEGPRAPVVKVSDVEGVEKDGSVKVTFDVHVWPKPAASE